MSLGTKPNLTIPNVEFYIINRKDSSLNQKWTYWRILGYPENRNVLSMHVQNFWWT